MTSREKRKSFTQRHQRRSTTRKIIEMVEGTVQMTREGFGFVVVPDSTEDYAKVAGEVAAKTANL